MSAGHVQVRKFGTDVSNLPSVDTFKTPKKTFPPKLKIDTPVFVPSAEIQKNHVNLEEIIVDDEIIITSPKKTASDSLIYSLDFLLSFQKFSYEPIEGLIPEVLPGYVNLEEELFVSMKSPARQPASPKFQNRRSTMGEDLSSPHGGVVFKSFNKSPAVSSSPCSKDSTSPSKLSSPARRNLRVEIPPVSPLERSSTYSQSSTPTPSPSTHTISAVSPNTLVLEWRAKKVAKKLKPKEEDGRRLSARQKQIDIGMNTPGYKRFLEQVPAELRTKEHPRIPDIFQICSKRSWDGQVRKWRRQLHQYDPPELAGQTSDDSKGDENEDFGEDTPSEEEYSSEGEEEEQSEQIEVAEHSV